VTASTSTYETGMHKVQVNRSTISRKGARTRKQAHQGFTVIITTPCAGTVAENWSAMAPLSW